MAENIVVDIRVLRRFVDGRRVIIGEGGAGTYSDGKLYTRSDKRGNVTRILDVLVEHGAHPHVGSNLLPKVVKNLRPSIEGAGGIVSTAMDGERVARSW